MAAKLIKDDVKKRRIPTNNLKNKKLNHGNNNSIPFQVVQNKTSIEKMLKDYVVDENEQQELPKKELSQKKLLKLEKVKSRKEKSLPTKSLATEGRTIFVGNVNIQSNRDDIKKFFRKYGEIESVRFRGITPQAEDISKKEAAAKKLLHPHRKSLNAYVRFKEESSVEKALEANGEIFKDYHIHVDRAMPSAHQKDKNSVFVGNLPWEVNEEDLWKFFGSCGKVTNVRLVRSATTGAGKGFGFVSFESNDGVHLALHLDGKKFMQREIRVKKTVKKIKVKGEKNPGVKSGKRKGGLNGLLKSKKVSKPMDVSFLKNDKPKLFDKKMKEKGRKRKRHDKGVENVTNPTNFKGIRAVKNGKIIKKGKKKINQAERRKIVLAKKLSTTL